MCSDQHWINGFMGSSAVRAFAGDVDVKEGAAGQPRPSGRSNRAWPCGLTDREIDVLLAGLEA